MDNKDLAKILKAVGSENRIFILKCLHKSKELSVGDLAEVTNLAFRSVSKDLAILRSVELVQSRNFNLTKCYSINPSKFPQELLPFLEN